jgi:hypothetical protein
MLQMRLLVTFVLVVSSLSIFAQHAPLSGYGIESYPKTEVAPERLTKLRKNDEGRSTSELLARLRNLEQVCIMAAPEEQLKRAQRIDERIMDLRKILEVRAKSEGLESLDAPEDYLSSKNPTWQMQDVWKARVEAASPERRCEWVELLSAVAIARLSTIPASKPICKFQDFICEDASDALFVKDSRRLNWELRHLATIESEELPPKPESCRANLSEMKERLQFAEPSKDKSANRWPLGRAIGMCGRPMSAHYLDQAYMDGKTSEPKAWKYNPKVGWDEILDIEEQDINSKN